MTYSGDPLLRSSVQFLVHFADGEKLWLPWSRGLFDSDPYEYFCRSRAELAPLIDSLKKAAAWAVKLRKRPITVVAPGDTVFIDLRTLGTEWYAHLKLPELYMHTYYVACTYGPFATRKNIKILLDCSAINYSLHVDHVFSTFMDSAQTHRLCPLPW